MLELDNSFDVDLQQNNVPATKQCNQVTCMPTFSGNNSSTDIHTWKFCYNPNITMQHKKIYIKKYTFVKNNFEAPLSL